MIRVLQCVNNMHRAGLETVLMNYYRNIDRTQIQFDFLTHRPERDDYDDEIEALGGRIYRAPRLYPQNYPAYFRFMKQFFAEHPEYKIVHSHIDSMSYLPLLAAKKAGVPIRIAHSHSTGIDADLKYGLKQSFRRRIPKAANYLWACGEKAGQFLFRGKPFAVIPNAVDAGQYLYSPQIRQKKREELDLQDKLVIGHAGRFCYPKNHSFLLDIFSQLVKKEPNAVLLFVGKGELESKLRQKTRQLQLEDKVLFAGSRSDLNEIYQAMDVLVMPSRFEGIPMVGIEAQFSGLPCVFSDQVPEETAFTDNCRFVGLNQSAEQWAAQVLRIATQPREQSPVSEKYDIRYAHKLLETQYCKLHSQCADSGQAEKVEMK